MLERLHSLLWGKFMILLLGALGIRLLWTTRFYLFRKGKALWRLTFGSGSQSKGAPSPFRTMCTALGGTIGVGNTVGVAAAIAAGGAGAVFWMMLSSLFAMIIKFCEIWLSARCRDPRLGFGGPMHYMKKLLHSPALALVFSLSVLPCSLFVGNLAQSRLVCSTAESLFTLPPLWTGILFALAVGAVIFGGAQRITAFCSVLVPFMSIAYLLLCLTVLLSHLPALPTALLRIVTEAFVPRAAVGGVGGFALSQAISCGFSKGMFSNEAGMGSAPMAHTQSGESDPEKQGAWGIVEVMIDTVVICPLTALVILTGSSGTGDPEGWVLEAFTRSFGGGGGIFFLLSMSLFAFASICAWSLYADCALKSLTNRSLPLILFRALFVLAVPLSAILSGETVLALSDVFNALMALPNLLSLWVISGLKPIKKEWRQL